MDESWTKGLEPRAPQKGLPEQAVEGAMLVGADDGDLVFVDQEEVARDPARRSYEASDDDLEYLPPEWRQA